MPLFNRLSQTVSAVAVLLTGLPKTSAQMAAATQPTPPPIRTLERDVNTFWSLDGVKQNGEPLEPGPGQQSWRISKGKDHGKLPPEYQWDTAPTPVNTPYPVYPYELLRNKVAGKVRAYFIIGLDGRVARAEFDEDAKPEFGQAVRAMLDSCRFHPAKKKDGTPACANVGIEYVFQPKGRSDAPVTPEARLILHDLEKKPANILNLHDLDEPLKPLVRTLPAYPTALRQTLPAGDAEVEFFVDADGTVQLPHIKSCSAPEFGYAAVQAVAAWRFEVPKRRGRAVVVRAAVPIEFEARKAIAAQK